MLKIGEAIHDSPQKNQNSSARAGVANRHQEVKLWQLELG
jgi:hypothetical protein